MINSTVKWQGGMAFTGVSASGHEFRMDAAKESGGEDSGARPTEVVLAAMGGCSAMDVVSILTKMQVKVDSFEIALEADRTTEPPKVFSRVVMVYKLEGAEIPPEKAHRAIQLSLDKYCTVANMVNKTAKIEYRLEINGQAV